MSIEKTIEEAGKSAGVLIAAQCLEKFQEQVREKMEEDGADRDGVDYAIAEQCGVPVRTVQAAMRGQLHAFTTDQLVNMLDEMGVKVSVGFGD